MLGMELVKNQIKKEPAKEACATVVQECLRNGLIIPSAGIIGNVLRMLVSLVITDDQLNEGLDILEDAVKQVSS